MTQRPKPLSRKKKLLFSAIIAAVSLLLLELGARLVVPPRRAGVHGEHERVIEVLGLPAINATMVFDPDLFWVLKPNLREFRVAGAIRDTPIDFTITTNSRGLRGGPTESKGSAIRILALGDSCTFGVGVANHETWPAQLQTLLQEDGDRRRCEVINAGVPGYTAFQGLRYLEQHGWDLEPDLVVACFGYNDKETWASRSDAQTARRLAAGQWEAPLMHSRLYVGLRRMIHRKRMTSAARPEKGRPRLSADEFHDALGEIKARCDARGVPLIYVVWPVRGQILQRYAELGAYQPIVARTSRESGAPLVDLVDAFLKAPGPLFLDHVHANAHGCRIAAEAIAARVRPVLGRLAPAEPGH